MHIKPIYLYAILCCFILSFPACSNEDDDFDGVGRLISSRNAARYKKAEETNIKAIEINRDADVPYHNRGEARLFLKKYKESEDDFTYYLKNINNKSKESYYLRGLAKLEQGKLKEACQDLYNASKLDHAEAKKKLKKYCPTKIYKTKFERKTSSF